jgi:hypothetical protein
MHKYGFGHLGISDHNVAPATISRRVAKVATTT